MCAHISAEVIALTADVIEHIWSNLLMKNPLFPDKRWEEESQDKYLSY